MLSRDPKGSALRAALTCLLFATTAAASANDEFKVKREGPFEFAQKPVVTRNGDRVTITFETKAFCDVTVAIEDERSRIVRHLASGVLGRNAPAPFQKNSKKQTIVWDGKDDLGAYIEDKDKVAVRVSLGMKARFERQFLWSPHVRIQGLTPPFCAQPEGVYVFDGAMVDHLRLFDHDGNYMRTIYPFPADKVGEVKGVKTHTFPQSGRTLPFKGGNYQSTLLTSGTNRRGNYLTQLHGTGATAMAVRNGRIALGAYNLNRLATDSTTGGLPLDGPDICVGNPRENPYLPRSMALSPDGKTVYVTGFSRTWSFSANKRIQWVHGVGRIDFETGTKMEVFAGNLTENYRQGGSGPGEFKVPFSVDCDPQGRIYVADHFNDRIQVFDLDGKHLKDIKTNKPSDVCIDPRNGDIYVFSWTVDSFSFRNNRRSAVKPTLTHLGPFGNPKVQAEHPFSIRGRLSGGRRGGTQYRAAIDPWAPGDRRVGVWLIRGDFLERGGNRWASAICVMRCGKDQRRLDLVKDFAKQAAKDLPRPSYQRNRYLYPRPTTGELYVRDDTKGGVQIVIDPETGKSRVIELPFSFVNMTFDIKGRAYLRTFREVVRFDILPGDRWREIPFDYGQERKGVGHWKGKKMAGGAVAAVVINSPSIWKQGGIWVSPKGHMAVAYEIGHVKYASAADPHEREMRRRVMQHWKVWKPTLYPGRGGNAVVTVWDQYGKVVYADAVRGVGVVDGTFIDKDNNLYITSAGTRAGYFDPMAGTLVKVRPESKIYTTSSPIKMGGSIRPDRPFDTSRGGIGNAWWEGAEWFYGGIGFCGKNNSTCACTNYRPAHDYFARTFVPEIQHYTVAVLDTNGNVIMRIGQYGNVDDGVPLVNGSPVAGWRPRPLGGDEVGLFYPAYLGTHTDQRLYVSDPGNNRTVSVKLGYSVTERISLKDVSNEESERTK